MFFAVEIFTIVKSNMWGNKPHNRKVKCKLECVCLLFIFTASFISDQKIHLIQLAHKLYQRDPLLWESRNQHRDHHPYHQAEKEQQIYRDAKNQEEIAENLGVTKSTIGEWLRDYNSIEL